MEGFRKLPKVQCFKEGGYVTKKEFKNEEKRESKREEKKDIAEDKKLIKKAVGQHEALKHKGEEKTELKLKTGGRAKKEKGTVKKYKSGGCVTDKKEAPKKMANGGLSKVPSKLQVDSKNKDPIKPGPAPSAGGRGRINPLPVPATDRGVANLANNRPDPMEIIRALQTGQNTLAPAQPMGGAPVGGMPGATPRQPMPMPQGVGGMGQAQPALGLGQAAPVQQMQPGLPAMKRGGKACN